MLVLSRGRNDKVVFPSLGITVEILRVKGSRVRIGIDAPKEIPVLRDEIASNDRVTAPMPCRQPANTEVMHAMRNHLQTATLGLRLLQRRLEISKVIEAESTIFNILNEIKGLEDVLDPTTVAPAAAPPAGKGCRTLIVEDNPNECELLAGYLRLSGFEVSTAIDGLDAMVHLSKNDRPDVVLLDMKMPRLDGYKTVSAIRQNPNYQSLKIFAVTGTNQAESPYLMGPETVDRWFRKPVDPKLLVDAIRRELAGEFAMA